MLSVLVFYLGYYIKFHWNKIVNVIVKLLSFILLIALIYFVFNNIGFDGLNNIVNSIYERLRIVYIPSLLFVKSISDIHIISFVIYIVINVVVIYLFML